MKKIILSSFFLLWAGFGTSLLFAQSNWSPIGLDVAGHNKVNGIEASYQLNNCNGEDVVFVQLINHNKYAVTVEWYPAVFTKESKWIRKENLSDKKSIALNPNAELAGDCSGTNQMMMIHLKDFSITADNFFRYGTSNFSVLTK